MGSVIDNIKCPKCGYEEATSELYYKINQQTIFCGRCGYSWDSGSASVKPKQSGGKGVIYVGFDGGGSLNQFSSKYLKLIKELLKKNKLQNKCGESPTEIYYITKTGKGKWKKFYLIKLIEAK
jgi:hypothetical protein